MRNSIFTGILFLLVSFAHAQATFNAEVSADQVRIGDIIQVTYAVQNGSVSRFVPPNFAPFDVVYGPAKSQSFRVINGKVTRSMAFTYGIRATQQGKFVIPGAAAEVDGDSRKTNAIVITVRPAGFPGSNPTEITGQVKGNDDLFVMVTADRKQVWQGEQVVVTYKLYYRVSFNNVQILKTPSYNGFLMHDFKVGQQKEEIVAFNGKRYYTQLFKKVALFPSSSGVLRITPIEIECTVVEEIPDPNFNDPFFSSTREKKTILRSNEVTLQVKPLPVEGKPANFSGAVGQFSLEAGLDRQEVAAGDGATIKAMLRGEGNLKIAQISKPQMPGGLAIYDPTITDNFTPDRDALRGDRSFDFVVVPEKPGNYTIPPISFSYFDPFTGKYVTLNTGSFSLKATPAAATSSDDNVRASRGWGKAFREGLEVAAYVIGLGLLVLSILGFLFFFWYRSRKRRKIRPIKTVAPESKHELKHSKTSADERMAELHAVTRAGDAGLFYRKAPEILWEAAKDAGMEKSVYQKAALLQFLKTKDPSLAEKAAMVLENAEMHLYGGAAHSSPANDLIAVEEILSRIL